MYENCIVFNNEDSNIVASGKELMEMLLKIVKERFDDTKIPRISTRRNGIHIRTALLNNGAANDSKITGISSSLSKSALNNTKKTNRFSKAKKCDENNALTDRSANKSRLRRSSRIAVTNHCDYDSISEDKYNVTYNNKNAKSCKSRKEDSHHVSITTNRDDFDGENMLTNMTRTKARSLSRRGKTAEKEYNSIRNEDSVSSPKSRKHLKRARSSNLSQSNNIMDKTENYDPLEHPSKRRRGLTMNNDIHNDDIISNTITSTAINTNSISSSSKSTKLNRKDLLRKCCREILNQLSAIDIRDHNGLFAEPVLASIAPDYHNIVKHPMDLLTIRQRLEGDSFNEFYPSLASFAHDVVLISTNCLLYNENCEKFFMEGIRFIHSVKTTFLTVASTSKLSVPEVIYGITSTKYPLTIKKIEKDTKSKQMENSDSSDDWGREYEGSRRRTYKGFISRRRTRTKVISSEEEFNESEEESADSKSSDDDWD